MPNYVEAVIKIAEGEVGYLEKSKAAYQKDNSILYEKLAGAGSDNYTKYGKEMHDLYPSVMDFPAAWCDAFVDWCFQKAYGVSNAKKLLGGNFDDYTPNSAKLYKNQAAYFKSPKVGDQVFFRNSTRICHTGIVYKVDDKKVYCIEGNTSGASGVVANGGGVCKKSYPLGSTSIDGYGRPKYDLPPKFMSNGIDYSPVFDAKFYSDNYADLKKAFGTNEDKLFQHFCSFGMKEKRQAKANFNVLVYRERYADLKKAFGDNWSKYYEHYCIHGIKEGRKAI